jgi:hypothetical protein
MKQSAERRALLRTLIADPADGHSTTLRAIAAETRALQTIAHDKKVDLADNMVRENQLNPALVPGKNRLVKLFNSLAFTEAYEDWELDGILDLTARLAADPDFRARVQGWKKASSETILETACLMGQAQQEIFCKPVLGRVPDATVHWLPARLQTIGLHQPPAEEDKPHRLSYRVDPASPMRDAAEGLGTIFHENLHMSQTALAFAFARGAMAGHALEADARLHFMTLMDDSAYLPGVHSLYMAHPAERDAWDMTPLFVKELRTALKPYGLKI